MLADARSVVQGICVPGWKRSGGSSVLILVLEETTGLDKQHHSLPENQIPSLPEWDIEGTEAGGWGGT